MTRILAFGDTQIGVNTVDLSDQRAVLDQIVQIALDRKADIVIHGGDVFEGPVVLPEHLQCFVDGIAPLWEHGIDTLILRGNGRHDMATREVHALDVLRKITGIYVSDRPELMDELGLDVNIVTLPWVHPGRLIARMNGTVEHERVSQYTAKLLVQIARELGNPLNRRNTDRFVLVAHWAISGSRLPSGLGVEEMREPVLPWADLDAIGYDVVIGAHIHEPQRISDARVGDKTRGVVVGSPQQLNFGEYGDHGCWLIELNHALVQDPPSRVLAEFIPIEAPRFVTWTAEDAVSLDGLREGFVGIECSGDIVRVRYRATEAEAKTLDHDLIRRAYLAAGAKRVQIEPQIIRSERTRAPEISEQLDMADALAKWCDANSIEDGLRAQMLERLQEWRAA